MMRRHLLLLALPAVACRSDQAINELHFDNVAVATGDFDRVEEALDRNAVTNTEFEGYIYQPVYAEDVDPSTYALTTETLFTGTNAEGDPQMFDFDAVFLNSGTRGMGQYAYNSLESDDSLVTNAAAVTNLQDFVARKRTVVVTDWAYDMVETAWPDAITFLGEADGLDAAQVGTSDSVVADVTNTDLAAALGNQQLEVFFDFSHWSVIEDAGPDATVWLRGNVEYRASGGEGYATLEDVPLLVSFPVGSGLVIFSSFSWRAQRSQVSDILLSTLIEGFGEGAVKTSGGSGA